MKVPAPIGGLNYLQAQNRLPPTDARVLDNWIPDSGFCKLREGRTEQADLTAAIGPLACQSYSCSALEDYCDDNGIVYVRISAGEGAFPWPFAEDAGDTELFRYYADYISAPTIRSDWSGSGVGDGVRYVTCDGWDQASSAPSFCGGNSQCANIDESATLKFPSSLDAWGNHAAGMIITGYNGTEAISGIISRNTGKPWNFEARDYGSWTPYSYDGGNSWVTISSAAGSSGFTEQTLSFRFDDTTSAQVNIGRIGNIWSYIEVSFSSGQPYAVFVEDVGIYDDFEIRIDITISVRVAALDGSRDDTYSYSRTIRIQGGRTNSPSSPPYIRNITQRNLTIYNTPAFFYNVKLSCMAFFANVGETDSDELLNAALRNTEGYTPPEYCND